MEEQIAVQRRGRKTLRITLYLILFVVLGVAIYLQAKKIDRASERKIASTYSQWEENGKPVNVFKAIPKVFKIFEKTTAKISSEGALEAYVAKGLQEKLKVGQKFYVDNGDKNVWGSIVEVGETKDINNGLYRILSKTDKSFKMKDRMIVPIRINTRTLENTIVVPAESVQTENGHSYVWKTQGDIAKKIEVTTGETDGYDIALNKGVKSGDLIIVEGLLNLKEDDKVMVHKCEGCSL